MAVVATAALALPVAPGAARSAASCAVPGYSYAGYATTTRVRSVSATIGASRAPEVAGGHVAAWLGVGSLHAGPHNANVWLQAGLAAYAGSTLRLYVEVVVPGAPRRYVELARDVAPSRPHHIAVTEQTPGMWQASVDGTPAGAPLYLPGSERGLPAVATAESWTPAHTACNGFAFSFNRVQLGSGSHLALRSPVTRLAPTRSGFSAAA